MLGIIDKCGVRGDATLCVVIFIFSPLFVNIFSFGLYRLVEKFFLF